jgi:hypothetical protein
MVGQIDLVFPIIWLPISKSSKFTQEGILFPTKRARSPNHGAESKATDPQWCIKMTSTLAGLEDIIHVWKTYPKNTHKTDIDDIK